MRCIFCGEPWDLDTLHEVIEERLTREAIRDMNQEHYERHYFTPLLHEFQQTGCVALGAGDCRTANPTRNPMLSMINDLLGDDVDGIESMIEDVDAIGGFR